MKAKQIKKQKKLNVLKISDIQLFAAIVGYNSNMLGQILKRDWCEYPAETQDCEERIDSSQDQSRYQAAEGKQSVVNRKPDC